MLLRLYHRRAVLLACDGSWMSQTRTGSPWVIHGHYRNGLFSGSSLAFEPSRRMAVVEVEIALVLSLRRVDLLA
jgi:hypothetical protein